MTSLDVLIPRSASVIPTSDFRTRTLRLPSVYRVIVINEIVAMITVYLFKAELLNLGMSCRVFYEPAMDRLWHTIFSLAHLLLCLPVDLVETSPSHHLRHPVVSFILCVFPSDPP